ncbi:MAG: DUF1934 domain-containing protein [Ruminococcaceae bacterium]|nr:DUF1934 domain-containing protein [Oscillospiraceae bacterium]
MDKKALIKVVGTQCYGKDRDKIELTTVGTFEETKDSYVLKYNEEQEPPYAPIKTTLSLSKDEKTVSLMREGKSGSLLIIERSKRNLCNYATDFGDILMGIYGKNIEHSLDENGGRFNFDYDIDINGAISSQNEVEVTYKLKRNN